MRRAGAVLILLGALFAVLAGVMLFALYPRQTKPPPEPTVEVVVAFQNIPERTEIGADQLGKASWPQHIPTPMGAFGDTEEIVGKLSTIPIFPGQPVIGQYLIGKEELKATHSNAALILEPGTQAIAIPVDVNSDVAEALQPGDRVDVIATFSLSPVVTDTQTASGQGLATHYVTETTHVTQRLLQDVLVLQVGQWPRPVRAAPTAAPEGGPVGVTGQTTSGQASNQRIVVLTLQVKQQDAMVLKFMEAHAASFALSLRAANDHAPLDPTPVTIEYLQKRFGFTFTPEGQ